MKKVNVINSFEVHLDGVILKDLNDIKVKLFV